jgi:hypothetical protein
METLKSQASKTVLADCIIGLEILEYCILSECCVIVFLVFSERRFIIFLS